MIPVIKDNNKNPLTFRSLVLNDPTDDEKSTYHIEDVLDSDAFQQQFEPLPDRDGSQAYKPYHMQRLMQVRGWVRGESLPELYDKIETLNSTFHPVNCYLADSVGSYNRGYLPIDFDVPTDDLVNYPTGVIPSCYYVQALRLPVTLDTKFDGFSTRIDFLLRAVDPRRYLQTGEQEGRTGNGSVTVDNSLATRSSYPVITIGLPSGTPTGGGIISHSTGTGTVLIDLVQLAASTTYILDMQAKTFVTGATNKIAAVSGASQFFDILPQSQTVTFAGFAAGTTFSVAWVRAFV